MNPEAAIRIIQEALMLTLLISGPAVLAAVVVGLVISVFQAATQIQERSLPEIAKIIVVYLVLGLTGSYALRELVLFAASLFERIAEVSYR